MLNLLWLCLCVLRLCKAGCTLQYELWTTRPKWKKWAQMRVTWEVKGTEDVFFYLYFSAGNRQFWCFPKQCVSERRDISYTLHEILKSVRAGNDSVKKKTAMQWEQNKFRAHQLIMGSFQASYEVSRALLIFRVEGSPVLKLHCAAWLGANR